ncbi:hypothetical protein J4403_03645 [Candidatus Woesearchaeota archaeon]|nr:hypothetical protein [uncultured archaeon]MBS3167272.1 hypothetical protein [Candidatus Woesearchaeota archaeon]
MQKDETISDKNKDVLVSDKNKSLSKNPQFLPKEISDLRRKLNTIDESKENWFSKKESLKKQISSLVKELKDIKFKKDELNKKVHELKKQREAQNLIVKEKIAQLKEKRSSMPYSRDDKTYNYTFLKKKIEELDMKIITEALSPSQEKKVMDEIKLLKRNLREVETLHLEKSVSRSLSTEINEAKKKAEELHQQVQQVAKESQEYHLKFIEFTKKINELRKTQEEAFKTFISQKDEFTSTAKLLEDKLQESTKFKREVEKKRTNKKQEENKKTKLFLNQKIQEVNEKMKRGEKLTKDDLLILQADANS